MNAGNNGNREKGSDPSSGYASSGSDPYSRLRWRCRRGMRELDRILEAFLETRFDGLDPAEKQRFAEILELPDPDLHAYLLGRAEPADPELARFLRFLRTTGVAEA